LLIFACSTGRDDPADIASHRIDDSDQFAAVWADGDRADFSFSVGTVFKVRRSQRKNGVFEIDPMFAQIELALALVPIVTGKPDPAAASMLPPVINAV
jgi:hypothetical protein